MKDAALLEESGLKKEAMARYASIHESSGKAEALIAQRRVAQSMLDDMYLNAKAKCASGDYQTALRSFDEAEAFINAHPDLELKPMAGLEMSLASCKNDYVNALYNRAEQMALSAMYDEALLMVRQIYSIDRDNKKAQYLENLCKILPNYKLGVQAYEQGSFREAYEYFDRVCKLDATYKDASTLRNECLVKSSYTLAYIPLQKNAREENVHLIIAGGIKSSILALKSPFVKLIEREQLNAVLQEQSMSMGALVDNQSAIQAGKLLGARYILTGEVLGYRTSETILSSIERKGFVGNRLNGKKIKYTVFEGQLKLEGTFRFQLLDAVTGQIYASETIPMNQSARTSWAVYGGNDDPTDIYPGEWKFQLITSKADYVDEAGKAELTRMFENRDGMKYAQLSDAVLNEIGQRVSAAIDEFRP